MSATAKLSDDLIAARALIDTPDKFFRLGFVKAINIVTDTRTPRNAACVRAIRESRGPLVTDWSSHQQALERIDRAIAKAKADEQGDRT